MDLLERKPGNESCLEYTDTVYTVYTNIYIYIYLTDICRYIYIYI